MVQGNPLVAIGRYAFGYTFGNLVLRRQDSGDVKHDFRTFIQQYTSPNEKFEYGYPHSKINALTTFFLQKDSKNVVCCTCLQRLQDATFFSAGNMEFRHSIRRY